MTIALSAPRISDPDPIVLSTTQYHDVTQPDGNFVPFYINNNSKGYEPQSSNTGTSESTVTHVDFSESAQLFTSYKDIVNTFLFPSGLGPSCLLKANKYDNLSIHSSWENKYTQINSASYIEDCQKYRPNYSTKLHIKLEEVQLKGRKYFERCACKSDNVGLECNNKDASHVPHVRMPTGDVLQNATVVDDFEDYLLFTTEKYRQHRYMYIVTNT